jgi:hypothetical protein
MKWEKPMARHHAYTTLNVNLLEERNMPTTAASVPPPIHPPQMVLLVEAVLPSAERNADVTQPMPVLAPLFVVPIQDTNGTGSAVPMKSAIDTDLLGRGGAEHEEPPFDPMNLLGEELPAEQTAPRPTVPPQRSETETTPVDEAPVLRRQPVQVELPVVEDELIEVGEGE